MDSYPAADDIPDPVDFQHHELMEFLLDNREMRQTARSAVAQGLWAGGAAVAGGLVLGPVGGMIGGITGSIVGYMRSDPYDGALAQLLRCDQAQKRRLVESVGGILTSAGAAASSFSNPEAFRGALVQFVSQRGVRDQVWKACLEAMKEA